MKIKKTKKSVFRVVIQIIFLGIFLFLILQGRLQLWMPIFAGGVLFSLIFSRFYCGWMCPMGTLFRPINWIYGKLGIKRFKTPNFLNKKVVRYVILLLMAAALILSMKFKIRTNILIYVTIISIFITLFFEESFWHNNLCPYGTILSLSSRPSRLSVKIDDKGCTSCGLCQKVCPVDAIITLETKKRQIVKNECLVCFKCQEICPVDVIQYRS
ncbi:MAG: 4Fe-4S binding protein [Spirochaetaceae bacterium]|nr:4Fe-4S binding protein [Spirochaetaceae bacterium]